MALPRSDAGVRLRAKTDPTRIAIFYAPDPRRAPARIRQVACLFIARQLDWLLTESVPGRDRALRCPDAAARRPYLVVLAIARKQAIICARCRESSSIFRASGFYDDSDFLK